MISMVPEMQALVDRLGNLRDGLQVSDPSYAGVVAVHREASDCLETIVGRQVDEADAGYVAFSKAILKAMKTLERAIEDTGQAARIIGQVAKVVDLAGQVAGKGC